MSEHPRCCCCCRNSSCCSRGRQNLLTVVLTEKLINNPIICCVFLVRAAKQQVKTGSPGTASACRDSRLCLKTSLNRSVSRACWPVFEEQPDSCGSECGLCSWRARFPREYRWRAIKRASGQKNLSTPDTSPVVWLYAADRFDGGQTERSRVRGRGGPAFCLLSGSVNSPRGKWPIQLSGHGKLTAGLPSPARDPQNVNDTRMVVELISV